MHTIDEDETRLPTRNARMAGSQSHAAIANELRYAFVAELMAASEQRPGGPAAPRNYRMGAEPGQMGAIGGPVSMKVRKPSAARMLADQLRAHPELRSLAQEVLGLGADNFTRVLDGKLELAPAMRRRLRKALSADQDIA